jgi:hypothetical protein
MIAIVDPLREFLSQDDGWSLCADGRAPAENRRIPARRLVGGQHAGADLPHAAGLAHVFGYSLSLRDRDATVADRRLAAFVALLRELDVEPPGAAVLSLGLLASPLVAMLSFTFMSDVQFMAWLLVATWLYVRGVRRASDATVLLASLAAGCAIGTRQFGVAVVGGLLLAGLLARPTQRPPWRRLLLGAAIPLLVGLWRLRAGYIEANFRRPCACTSSRWFLTRPPLVFSGNVWRIGTVVHYSACRCCRCCRCCSRSSCGGRRPLGVFQPDARPRGDRARRVRAAAGRRARQVERRRARTAGARCSSTGCCRIRSGTTGCDAGCRSPARSARSSPRALLTRCADERIRDCRSAGCSPARSASLFALHLATCS